MNKVSIGIIFVVVLVGSFVLLVRNGRLPNPVENFETDNEAVSAILGTINNLFGFVPESHIDEGMGSLEEEFAKSGFPAELFSFDVTKNKAIFGVVSSNPSTKSMVLRYSFPFDRRGKVIEVFVGCPLRDSKIITYDPETQETEITKAVRPLYEIANPETDSIQGICGDENCTSIVAECELARTSGDISEIQPSE